MKKAIIGTAVLFLSLGVVHLLILPVNKELHEKIINQRARMKKHPAVELKAYRLQLETQQRKDMMSYKWLDQRKEYAEIPIQRAFDYYLRRPQP